jgi:hypothetical protein
MITYNVANWYWIVGGDNTQVFSSARMAYVPVTDATYQAWLASGGGATTTASPVYLFEVLQAQLFPFIPPVTITSTATPALNGRYSIDPDAQQNITALSTGIAAGKPLPGGGSTFNYPSVDGTMHAFTGSDFLNFATAVEGYIYNYTQAVGAIVAGGSVALPSSNLTIP